MISLVIPFLDAFDKLERCLEVAIKNAGSKSYEIVLIDNGSKKPFDYSRFENKARITYIRNESNTGVLPTYKQGFEHSQGSAICFIHSDVLLHSKGWVQKIKKAFRDDEKLGLLGLFGAKGIGVDGGRSWSMGNLLGKEWGACECHELAAWHHGFPISQIEPAIVLDGVGMFFRQDVLYQLIENTDAFAKWRAPHHFYDKILSLKVVDLGYHVGIIDIDFDHWSGATANHSKTYDQTMKDWAKKYGYYLEGEEGDRMVYLAAEKQMFDEFQQRFPANVYEGYIYAWRKP